MLMKRNKEPHFGSLPEKKNLRRKHGACSLIITTTIIKSFSNILFKKTASLLQCINIVIS